MRGWLSESVTCLQSADPANKIVLTPREHAAATSWWKMRTYDLYEIKVASIFEARRLIEGTLSIILEEHESSFHRGPYFRAELAGDENIQLKLNLDPFEDVPHQDDYPDAAILLYVNNTNRSSELRNTFAELGDFINLLRHQEI